MYAYQFTQLLQDDLGKIDHGHEFLYTVKEVVPSIKLPVAAHDMAQIKMGNTQIEMVNQTTDEHIQW